MKAVRIHSYGPSDRLLLEDVPKPQPGANEFLVRIEDAGVNPIDWKIREGLMKEAMPTDFPMTIGQDFSGVVVKAPEAAMDAPVPIGVGDEVFGFAKGSYAEFASVSMFDLSLKPRSIDFATAASIPTAGLTAWQIIVDEAKVSPGHRVLIQGGAGGVGSFATQLAKWKGAEVFATASGTDLPYLRQIGVDRGIDYRSEDFENVVGQVDVVIDLVGGQVLERSYGVVKTGGLLISTVSGVNESKLGDSGARGAFFMMKHDAQKLGDLAKLIDQGVIKPRLAEVLPLADARDAQDRLRAGQSHGKIVLRIN